MTVDRIVLGRDADGGKLELWSDHPSAQELPHVLWPDEAVRYVFSGAIMRSGRPASRRWLIVLTDQRLICLKGRSGSALKVKDILYDAMVSVTNRSRILRATVVVSTSMTRLRLLVSRSEAQRIVQALNTVRRVQPTYYITPPPLASPPATPPPLPAIAVLPPGNDRVARLEALVDQLEGELESVKQQVAFLEQLLRTREASEDVRSA